MTGSDDLDKREKSPDDRYSGKYNDNYGGQYGSGKPGHYGSDTPGHYSSDKPTDSSDSSEPGGDLYKPDSPADIAAKEKNGGANGGDTRSNTEGGRHPNQVGRGHTGAGAANIKSGAGRIFGNRKLLLGAGVIIAAVIAPIWIFLSLLGVFKLDHLMSNVDNKAFLRHSASVDKMSSKMLSEYILLRLAENEDSSILDGSKRENLILRSKGVDNNNPFFDWYRTMRASSFEDELFQKHGVKFVSFMEKGKIRRPAIISPSGTAFMSNEIYEAVQDAINNLDLKTLNGKLRTYIDVEVLSRSDYRTRLNTALNDLTRKDQVLKRRFLRKAIANMTGVKTWRFFSDTADRVDQKKLDIRLKLYEAVVPDFIKNGRLVRCITGLDSCRPSRDVNDPQNRKLSEGVAGTPSEDKNKDLKDKAELEEKLSPDTSEHLKTIAKILQAANVLTKALNVVANLDMLSSIHHGMQKLVKFAVIAKGAQMMGLYQVFETSRDQIKSGNVNPTELNQFMISINNITNNDGWIQAVEGKGDLTTPSDPSQCTEEHKAALEKNPDLDKDKTTSLCPDDKIGDATKAAQREAEYNSSIGAIIGPIVKIWDGASKNWFTGFIINILRSIFNILNSAINNYIIKPILSALGLVDDMTRFMFWVFGRVMDFLGVGPIPLQSATSGQLVNGVIQGGGYTAETENRNEGASLTNPASHAAASLAVNQYRQARGEQTSNFERLLSLSNPDSAASKTVFGLSNLSLGNFLANMGSIFKSVLALPFNHSAKAAAADDGYRIANFAGIETYDFPSQCYSFDPLFTTGPDGQTSPITPLDPKATNVLAVLGNPRSYGVDHDPFTLKDEDMQKLNNWDTVRNNDAFYAIIYKIMGDKVDNADDVAVQIYNCYLLQNAVLGGMGYLHGYTNDFGYQESGATTPTPRPGSCPTLNSYTPNAAECKWIQYIAQKVLSLLPGSADQKASMAAQVTWWSLKEGVLDSSSPENPIGYSNCASSGNDYKIFLFDCHESHWQAGISGVQVQDHDPTTVAAEAQKRHPGMSLNDIIGQVAIEAGYPKGSAVYNQAINSSGTLRHSLIIRDPATGFVFSDGAVQPCIDRAGPAWCYGDWDTAQKFGADKLIAASVIASLTTYFKSFSGATP